MKKTASYLNVSYLSLALGGGEDYELLFTAPPRAKVDAVCIGDIVRSGIRVMDERGKTINVSMRGYEHFSI